jgi:predicted phosphate transport protein (TIGR00153 family)
MNFTFIPKEEKFFELFDLQAAHCVEAAKAFKNLARDWRLDSPLFARIRDIEHEADITTHEIKDKLNRTFVTPLDREDIFGLASEMDDIVDLIKSITSRMSLYRLSHCRPDVQKLTAILMEAAETLQKAIASLKDPSKSRRLLDYCIEVNRLENDGDQLLENAISQLFAETKDPIEVVKWEKVLEVTEACIDKCEDVAHTLESILVKQG